MCYSFESVPSVFEEKDMAGLDSRDGRTELEGKEGQDDATQASHVKYRVEESGCEGSLMLLLLLPWPLACRVLAMLLGFIFSL